MENNASSRNEIACTISVRVVYSLKQYLVNTRKLRRMCRFAPSRNSGLAAGGVVRSVWSEHFMTTVLHVVSTRYKILRQWKWRDQSSYILVILFRSLMGHEMNSEADDKSVRHSA
jgi:hypothetical protein